MLKKDTKLYIFMIKNGLLIMMQTKIVFGFLY